MLNSNISPPSSPPSIPKSKGTDTPLSLDLSAVPPLTSPSPPSNTLLITVSHPPVAPLYSNPTNPPPPQNLLDPVIFHPTSLLQIRTLISNKTPLHSFSPLKSFRRIVASFYTITDAITIHNVLSSTPIMNSRPRVYFGEPTPIEVTDQHLQAPQSQKMFFISPPPSPPFGWEVREEGPPNKAVHAEDLASALAGLRQRPEALDQRGEGEGRDEEAEGRRRSGSTTTMVFQPVQHGVSPRLPAVMVEDTTGTEEESPVEGGKILAHTARPPVELMQDS
ncbi:MAG: hypothetical protein LQ343_004992 [Gyalolechia ehrenbergii]|nr:MAG: hypothetical protein LQ343_004992 [Gyalolechia ehrenbergii]